MAREKRERETAERIQAQVNAMLYVEETFGLVYQWEMQKTNQTVIKSIYYMASITSGEMAGCDWLRSTFSGPLFSRNGPGRSITNAHAF